jgi:hypothetical protein
MENNNESKNPNFWEKLKLWQKIVIIVIGISIIGGIIGSLGGNDENYNETISIVAKGYFDDYPDVSVGKAFNNFFTNPKWENFVSDDGEQIVEFDGEASLDDENVLVEIQFFVDKSNDRFEIVWLGVDGEGQSDYEINDWIDTAYEYYFSKNGRGNSSNSSYTGNKPTPECSLLALEITSRYISNPLGLCDYYRNDNPEEYDGKIDLDLGYCDDGYKMKEAIKFISENPQTAYDIMMGSLTDDDYRIKSLLETIYDDREMLSAIIKTSDTIADCLP